MDLRNKRTVKNTNRFLNKKDIKVKEEILKELKNLIKLWYS